MFCKSLNVKCRQTSRRNFLRLAASIMVGIAFCVLAGCSESQRQQADAIDHSDSAAQNKQETELTPEPADPDIYDISVWENIESGIYQDSPFFSDSATSSLRSLALMDSSASLAFRASSNIVRQ